MLLEDFYQVGDSPMYTILVRSALSSHSLELTRMPFLCCTGMSSKQGGTSAVVPPPQNMLHHLALGSIVEY